jgi:hypothetical protein
MLVAQDLEMSLGCFIKTQEQYYIWLGSVCSPLLWENEGEV